ncbi:MAG: hypothetical protein IIA67_05855, partial [Planctomycetes bacterium]|nr:hypothetical protein [Planctomycetota bacterium]
LKDRHHGSRLFYVVLVVFWIESAKPSRGDGHPEPLQRAGILHSYKLIVEVVESQAHKLPPVSPTVFSEEVDFNAMVSRLAEADVNGVSFSAV